MILTNVAYYFIHLVFVLFDGHLREFELASSKLSNSWVAVSGFALMVKSLQILSILSALITGLAFAIASLASLLKSKVQSCLSRVLVGSTKASQTGLASVTEGTTTPALSP
ncbi:Protein DETOXIFICATION [Abeliophyllum distichum]|uniref:Protein DETOXIFICATION n=1 Tax=Abeliophyllum distichum TaxID=126358 RepID=A0ABD1UPH5_9LAMI